ncbi:MAG: ribosome biogenesis GTPase Der [Firmicutes bacterium]|nr:ribosome biogenesis GTPase Der [Bacillota bacterium]
MPKPILAIVGRPNVGKSTLFNKIAGARISIVEDTPGVTRDRVYAAAEWLGREFTMIDTGGLEPETDDFMLSQMLRQAEAAMESADVILFLTDGRDGLLDADREAAMLLRRTKKPVILAVNKIDDMRKEYTDSAEFYALGLGEPIAISSGQGLGIGDLLDEVVRRFPPETEPAAEEDVIKVAILGKPNVGKSSLVNKLLGEERVIVSDVPGTTRDAVDSPFTCDGQKYVLIDTAGMRRKSKVKESIERYGIVRAVAAVERADVCVIMIAADEGVSEQDSKIAGLAHERGRASVIAVNKWDKIEKDDRTMNKFLVDIGTELAFMPYAPKIFISALTGQRVLKLFGLVHAAAQNHAMRVATGVLNDVIAEATALNQPPTDKGRTLKVFYATQASVKPPTFVLFVNDASLMHFSYKRYLENRIREAFGFAGTPIRFVVRNRGEK